MSQASMTWRRKVLDHVGSRCRFFDPAEVEAAMMRGNAEVVPHRGWGGILKFFAPSPADRPLASLLLRPHFSNVALGTVTYAP